MLSEFMKTVNLSTQKERKGFGTIWKSAEDPDRTGIWPAST